MEDRGNRWSARPVLSLGLGAVVLLGPIAAGVGVAALLSQAIPRPDSGAGILWWIGLFVASTTTVWLVDRVARPSPQPSVSRTAVRPTVDLCEAVSAPAETAVAPGAGTAGSAGSARSWRGSASSSRHGP